MNRLILTIGLGFAAIVNGSAIADPGGGPSVTVVNPPANPAITSSVDDPGRTPYQFFRFFAPCAGKDCSVTAPAVPAGKRLVVRHFVVQGAASSSGTSVQAYLIGGGKTLSVFPIPLFFKGPQYAEFAADQAVLGYVDAGGAASAFLETDGSFDNIVVNVTITGYLLDCTVNQCAPIAP